MKSIGQALRELVPLFAPLGSERLPLLAAAGRVLVTDAIAQSDLPLFDNSAMDGYAVRISEISVGASVRVHGESRAGGPLPAALPARTSMRIFTGAPVPQGADTVIIQEHALRNADSVTFDRLPAAGANLRLQGSDMRRGDIALGAGTSLDAGSIALLAAQGHAHVEVYKRPRVAVLTTGDELREVDEAATPGTIVNSNAYALCVQIAAAGCEPWKLPSVSDRREDIAKALRRALEADVVLCTGGVSVGDYDHVAEAFQDAGVQVAFWKVAIKPGKPLLFGTAGRVPVLGLPGNPVSAMVTFEVFVKPGLLHMLGHRAPYPTPLRVELAHDHRHSPGRIELARATLQRANDGRLLAHLHARQGSGSLPSIANVDALVVLDADTEHFAGGAHVDALLLRALPGQSEPPFA